MFNKNGGKYANNLSTRDSQQVLKDVHSRSEYALDVVNVNSLVPKRYSKITWELQTLLDGTEDVKYLIFWGFGETESNDITIGDNPLGSTEKTTLNFNGLSASDLAGTYFYIYDDAGSVAVWFNLDAGDTQPSIIANRFLEVPIITGDTPTELALATQTVLHSDSEFTAVNSTTYVMIASITTGNKTNAVDGDSGVSISVTDGSTSINSKYIFIYDGLGNKYHAWWNVNSTGTDPDPDPGNSVGIEITLDAAETASTVAEKTTTALNNQDNFIASSEDDILLIKNTHEGSSLGIVDGDTGFEIQDVTDGEDKPIIQKIQVFYDEESCPVRFEVINHE